MLFIIIPIIMTFGLSLTNYTGGPNFSFTGLKNYIIAFTSPIFTRSLWITLKYVIFAVGFQILFALLFAIILNEKLLLNSFFRGVIFLPNIIASVAIGLSFMVILEPNNGMLNQLLNFFGLPSSRWLADPKSALGTIIAVSVWQNFGYYMIILLGGLQQINPCLYEAAEIDGAGALRKLISITIPGLSPVLFFSFTMSIIGGFKVFDLIYVMTGGSEGGGPAGSTKVVVLEIYQNAFQRFRFGYASAQSVILLIIILGITLWQYRQQKKWVTYDA
ncbi:sugar ABC transporter permease [Thiospirochaeta perfilievii]|uniref:Sugar ABC transporter permease n=2 Tax=Thiospirochaeta perfilievii TaxID=252967 RepID=A0A5C1QCQ0_9SPIO|nr:sugar ABC transporter permease [Thiospirochaeta perfilievii]